ncbi:MarR family winged helix-turn-helix transcriptional regulator [Rhizobium sp. PL01]|uniref:MarR family winged helix-turn-helix transcriptional regulator n=1 Tax=Rhizobium sp. PL01 TaxID=3085631 RepID=UPI002980C9C7|nr:MarR family winged helix-turn-helix transcriptional regulator [Rhizobium sp. PL01]MDW5318214.1 MarR family winged helix-turn-helix transcriptional regulator [Rhizobium sp. PL01]
MILSPLGSAFSEVVVEIFHLNGLALAAGDALAEPAGLSSARWQILGVVDHAAAPVANVARVMGLSRQAAQQTADALENEGFVEWKPNPHHKRAKLVSITAKGREALHAVERRHAAWANQIAALLGEQTLSSALTALRAIRNAMETQ